jgi:hypothetical protein
LSWWKNKKIPKQPEFGVLTYQTAVKMLKEGKIDTQTVWGMVSAGLKYSGLSDKGKKDCLNILSDYHEQRRSANPVEQAEIERRVNEFKLCLEDGYSPQEARELANHADYALALKWQNVFKYLPEAYILKGTPKEKAETMIQDLTICGGSLWIEAFQALINYHRHRYYVMDAPVISDMEYDWLKEQLSEVETETNKRTGRG